MKGLYGPTDNSPGFVGFCLGKQEGEFVIVKPAEPVTFAQALAEDR